MRAPESADDRPVVIHHDDVPMRVPAPRDHPEAPRRPGPGLRRAVLAGIAAGVLLAAALGGWLAPPGDGDDPVAHRAGPVGAGPVVPAPLGLDVTAPTVAIAGPAGRRWWSATPTAPASFSGSTEDWGDGVGTSSLTAGPRAAVRRSRPAAPAAPTSPTHTWSEPGSYPVTVAVVDRTPASTGRPSSSTRRTTVTVVVAGALTPPDGPL